MKKNNKKGFTLIEIIVTLGLILLITSVAIGSFIGISKQKKKEEWSLVKGQIETAAEQYLSSNKYMFEDINSGMTAYITVGELVEKSYLSKVSNPMTGKPLSYCNQVQVTYEDGKYTGKYVDSSDSASDDKDSCKYSGMILIKEQGAPLIELDTYCTSSEDNMVDDMYSWCIGNEEIYVRIKNNKSLKSLLYCTNTNNGNCDAINKVENSLITDTISSKDKKTTKIVATNAKASTIAYVNYYLDNEKPTCDNITAKVESNNYDLITPTWVNKDVNIKYECNDLHSGCVKNELSKNVSKTSSSTDGTKLDLKVEDKAGNVNNCKNVTVKIDKIKPTCNIVDNGTKGSNDWYTSNIDLSMTTSDSLSGVSNVYGLSTTKNSTNNVISASQIENTKGVTWYGYVKDNAGNENSCNKKIKKDSVKPSVSITKKSGNCTNNTDGSLSCTNATTLTCTVTCGVSGCNIYGKTDSGNWNKKTTNPYDFTKVSSGTHTKSCKAIANNGLQDETTKKVTVTSSNIITNKCYAASELKYEGTKGDNNWYTSDVKVKKGTTVLCTINKEGNNNCSYTKDGESCKSKNVKIDKTNPKIELFTIASKNSGYNTRNVDIKINTKDEISGVVQISTNMNDSNNKKTWSYSNKKDLIKKNYTGYIMSEYTKSGKEISPSITVKDASGRTTTKTLSKYQVYKLCSLTTSSYSGKCSNDGYRTKTQKDKYITGKTCSTKKEDCTIKSIQMVLNNNSHNHSTHPGMGGKGPRVESDNKGRLFDDIISGNSNTYTYSTSNTRWMDVKVGWNSDKTNISYAGAGCMCNKDFDRYFKVTINWKEDNTVSTKYVTFENDNTQSYNNKSFGFRNRNTKIDFKIEDIKSKRVTRSGCKNKENINVKTCGSTSGWTNVTTHVYKFHAGGKTSNTVTLYTKYFAKCGFSYTTNGSTCYGG